MSEFGALLHLLGVSDQLAPIEAAVTIARTMPIRSGRSHHGELDAAQVARGWLPVAVCAEAMAQISSSRCRRGRAFTAGWPWVALGQAVLAPALPVAVIPGQEVAGPDGVYHHGHRGVRREATGAEETFLELDAAQTEEEPDIDLLWFGDNARFLIMHDTVQIEDLFSRTVLPVRRRTIEHWLVRQLRHPPQVLDGLTTEADGEHPPSLEIRRPRSITATGWQDPEAFFRARVDVDRVERRAELLVVQNVTAQRALFTFRQRTNGWEAHLREGTFVFRDVVVRAADNFVQIRVTPRGGIDLENAGMRARLAFDLHADLVSLGAAQSS